MVPDQDVGVESQHQEFESTLYRVVLTATTEGKLTIDVVSIPAQKSEVVFKTAHRKRIRVDALMKAELMLSSSETMVCVYASCETDVERAITVASTAARNHTAQVLEDAQACFRAAHGKPTISRKAWAQD